MDEQLRRKIVSLLDANRIMSIATLRPDGWPQATTVGYANDGLTVYFLCGPDSQKAANIARDNRVSLTIEGERILRLLMKKYSAQKSLPLPMPKPEEVRLFRVTPVVISVLDYTNGFGHTDLVRC